MRTGLALALLSSLTLVSRTLSGETSKAERPLLRLACLEYPPYVGAELPSKGYVSEIVTRALDHAGYRSEIQIYPWERAFEFGKAGKVDGVFTVWHRKEREEWFFYSAALPANEIGFFQRRDANISFETLKDLAPYTIGTVRGYSNPPEFTKADFLKKSPGKDDEQNLRKLLAGRLDLVLIDRGVAEHLIRTHFADRKGEIVWIDRPIERLPQHVVFPKKSKAAAEVRRRFDAALAELRANGVVMKILEKHGVDPKTYRESP